MAEVADQETASVGASEDEVADLETAMASEDSAEDFDSLFSLPDDEIELRDPQEIEDASAEATYRHRGKSESYNGYKVNSHEKKRSNNHRNEKGRKPRHEAHQEPNHEAGYHDHYGEPYKPYISNGDARGNHGAGYDEKEHDCK